MNFQEMKVLDQKYIAGTYGRMDWNVKQGSSSVCQDEAGKSYVDFSSGIGVNSLGYTNPKWVKAVKDQIDLLGHISNLYYTEPQVRLAQALCEKTGMSKVFFANSGAEANEGAIKTARKYGSDKYGPHRCEIITLENSFHGRTIATLTATGQDTFHKHFGPFPEGFVYATANDVEDLKSKVNEKTCAIFVECIQGEGGVVPLEDTFVKAIADICKEKDILLMVDEIQTGVGRTGKFLCSEYFDISPDVATLAKGLGGGLPIGAVLFGEKTADTLGKGDHGSTFGGNLIAAAGALAVLEFMDDAFLGKVVELGDYFTEKLSAMEGVVSVSGKGLMLGIELEEGLVSSTIAAECGKEGLIVLTAKHKVRLLPPLTITKSEIDQGLGVLAKILKQEKEKLGK